MSEPGDWTRAAEVQLELYRWMSSERGQEWIRAWVQAEAENDPGKGDMYGLLAHAEPHKLLTADAIWVSPEISDVIDAAREGFKPEPMEREDFITPTGFLYFAKPLYMLDRNRLKVSVGAISWCPTVFKDEVGDEDGGLIGQGEGGTALLARVSDHDRSITDTEDKWGMAIALYSSANAEEDDFAAEHRAYLRAYGGSELISLHYTAVMFGDTLDEGQLVDIEGNYTGADEWWKLIQTTLRLMQQRVAVHGDERLPRATRRRAQAAGLRGLNEVMVIRLRRPSTKHGEEAGSTVEWSHRWIVDGHWRNQYFPASKRHRQIWISPYVKGPDDQPLVVKKRYYRWDR